MALQLLSFLLEFKTRRGCHEKEAFGGSAKLRHMLAKISSLSLRRQEQEPQYILLYSSSSSEDEAAEAGAKDLVAATKGTPRFGESTVHPRQPTTRRLWSQSRSRYLAVALPACIGKGICALLESRCISAAQRKRDGGCVGEIYGKVNSIVSSIGAIQSRTALQPRLRSELAAEVACAIRQGLLGSARISLFYFAGFLDRLNSDLELLSNSQVQPGLAHEFRVLSHTLCERLCEAQQIEGVKAFVFGHLSEGPRREGTGPSKLTCLLENIVYLSVGPKERLLASLADIVGACDGEVPVDCFASRVQTRLTALLADSLGFKRLRDLWKQQLEFFLMKSPEVRDVFGEYFRYLHGNFHGANAAWRFVAFFTQRLEPLYRKKGLSVSIVKRESPQDQPQAVRCLGKLLWLWSFHFAIAETRQVVGATEPREEHVRYVQANEGRLNEILRLLVLLLHLQFMAARCSVSSRPFSPGLLLGRAVLSRVNFYIFESCLSAEHSDLSPRDMCDTLCLERLHFCIEGIAEALLLTNAVRGNVFSWF